MLTLIKSTILISYKADFIINTIMSQEEHYVIIKGQFSKKT